jgi:O-succinylhomoserine sulfhydrylase
MFGTSIVMLNTIVSKFDIAISYVDLSDLSQWEIAAMPDAVATQACAPSSAANFLSKASTVGLVKRA